MKSIGIILVMCLGFFNQSFSQPRGNPHGPSRSRGSYSTPGPRFQQRAGNRHVRVINVRPQHIYTNMPRRGVIVRTIPHETVIISRGADRYHYHNGIFYRPSRIGFQVIPAPIGVRVNVLPSHFITINFGPRPYYYYYGTYYIKVPDTEEYEVAPPPIGARVNALPDGYEKVSLDGMIYYLVDGTYYKAIVDETGEVMYEVVGNKK